MVYEYYFYLKYLKFPVLNFFLIHESKYIGEDEMKIARNLINKLSKYDGMNFPQDINQQFQKLTDDKLKKRNTITQIEIIAKRSIYMLFNPFASWGMPFEMISLNRKEFGDAFWTMDMHYLSNFVINQFLQNHLF